MSTKPISGITHAIINYLISKGNAGVASKDITNELENKYGFERRAIQQNLYSNINAPVYIYRDKKGRHFATEKAVAGDYMKPRKAAKPKSKKPAAMSFAEAEARSLATIQPEQPKVNLDNIALRMGDVVSELMSANHEYRQALVEARDSLTNTASFIDSLLSKYSTGE